VAIEVIGEPARASVFAKTSALAALPVLLLLSTLTASAQDLALEIENGRVRLDVRNVPVRTILEEWARIGHTTIINSASITGGPVTLQLIDVPERGALEVLLRDVSGYILKPREDEFGKSLYEQILILPPSSVSKGRAEQRDPLSTPQPVMSSGPSPNFRPSSEPLGSDLPRGHQALPTNNVLPAAAPPLLVTALPQPAGRVGADRGLTDSVPDASTAREQRTGPANAFGLKDLSANPVFAAPPPPPPPPSYPAGPPPVETSEAR
jgi:hypothetical protein